MKGQVRSILQSLRIKQPDTSVGWVLRCFVVSTHCNPMLHGTTATEVSHSDTNTLSITATAPGHERRSHCCTTGAYARLLMTDAAVHALTTLERQRSVAKPTAP
jgi:hypothetical protein